jgi:hypothetical protein
VSGEGVERRLTTILAADVVGYSRLMATDEVGTLAQLKAHRKELFEPKATEHHGRVVKLIGDGTLMEFGSVVDAVIHRGFIPINTSTDVNSKLAEVKRPNQSESFMMMREDAAGSDDVLAGSYLAGPNQWPDLVGFREDVTAYHDALTESGRCSSDGPTYQPSVGNAAVFVPSNAPG